jgi:hypothetical protein
MRFTSAFLASLLVVASAAACGDDDDTTTTGTGVDPDTAVRAPIDRFAAGAGNLMVRDGTNGLPAANAPIDFDRGEPFITQGLSPSGEPVRYYNFDVQSSVPADIYVLFREGASAPLADQLNIVSVVPGDSGYSDFWRVVRVDVPADYVPNRITSLSEILDAGLAMTPTNSLVNCPIVPEGSVATRRFGGAPAGINRGWYQGKLVHYFSFDEKALTVAGDQVPLSTIFVTFNVNPDQPGGGPGSGFHTETGTTQTHNVVETLPGDAAYSPLWSVNVYDNASFDTVADFATAQAATQLAAGVALVNCPIVDTGSP